MDDRTIWFNIAQTAGVGPAAFRTIWTAVRNHQIRVTELPELTSDILQERLAISTRLAENLAEQFSQLRLPPRSQEPSSLLVAGDDRYPTSRIMTSDPPLTPILWAIGDTSLLSHQPTIGVVGSRDASDPAVEVAREIGSGASRAGVVVVSGMAAGIDSAAHAGALLGGVGTIGVLASGLARHRGYLPESEDSAICMVSEFSPETPWDGRRAMQRNSTIASLSDCVIVVASGRSGGTWEMAHLCAKRDKPLFVVDFDEDIAPGNQALLTALGAIRLSPNELESCWAKPPKTVGGSEQLRFEFDHTASDSQRT